MLSLEPYLVSVSLPIGGKRETKGNELGNEIETIDGLPFKLRNGMGTSERNQRPKYWLLVSKKASLYLSHYFSHLGLPIGWNSTNFSKEQAPLAFTYLSVETGNLAV